MPSDRTVDAAVHAAMLQDAARQAHASAESEQHGETVQMMSYQVHATARLSVAVEAHLLLDSDVADERTLGQWLRARIAKGVAAARKAEEDAAREQEQERAPEGT